MLEVAALLAFGSIGFWVLVLAAAVAVSLLVDGDRPGLATMVAAATVVFLSWFGDLDVLGFVAAHPLKAALSIPGYLLAGTAWGFFKWGFYLDRTNRKVKEAAAAFQQELEDRRQAVREAARAQAVREAPHGLRSGGYRPQPVEMPDEAIMADWRARALRNAGVTRPLPLKVREHKSLILAWMAYWPASLVWTMANDPVRRAFEAVYDRIGGSMQRMSDRKFSGYEDAFAAKPGE